MKKLLTPEDLKEEVILKKQGKTSYFWNFSNRFSREYLPLDFE